MEYHHDHHQDVEHVHQEEEENDQVLSTSPHSVHSLLLNEPLRRVLPKNKHKNNHNSPNHDDDMQQPKENETVSLSLSLAAFIQELPHAIHHRKVHSIAPGSPNDPICELFRRMDWSHPNVRDQWHDYALFDPSRPYTRNLIATDHASYTLLCLCWNPGQESPIHDHPCDGCWMQVCQGSVQECRYDSTTLTCTSDTIVSHGTLAYITDSMGYHKVGNPNVTQPAITIHLYSPPFASCRIWCSSVAMKQPPPPNVERAHDDDELEDDANDSEGRLGRTILPEPTVAHPQLYSEYGQIL